MAVTPNYSWPIPVATDYVKDGWDAIADLGNAIDSTVFGLGSSGLTLISSTTVGTGVSSVTVSSAFSSTYENYRIVIGNIDFSATTNIRIQFGSATNGHYCSQYYDVFGGGSTGTDRVSNGSSILIGVTGLNGDTYTSLDVLGPNLASITGVHGTYEGGGYSGWFGGQQNDLTQFTSFNILAGTGTMTGGKIRVYGYKNS